MGVEKACFGSSPLEAGNSWDVLQCVSVGKMANIAVEILLC